jgi:hypothetical protein
VGNKLERIGTKGGGCELSSGSVQEFAWMDKRKSVNNRVSKQNLKMRPSKLQCSAKSYFVMSGRGFSKSLEGNASEWTPDRTSNPSCVLVFPICQIPCVSVFPIGHISFVPMFTIGHLSFVPIFPIGHILFISVLPIDHIPFVPMFPNGHIPSSPLFLIGHIPFALLFSIDRIPFVPMFSIGHIPLNPSHPRPHYFSVDHVLLTLKMKASCYPETS